MTAIQRFALHGTIMNPHSSGPYVRHEDHLAAMQARCLAQIEEPAAAPGLTDGQLDDESYRVNDEPGFSDAFRAGARFAERVHGVTASAARAVTGKADWWRGRADEIEVQVARSGSQEAMWCYTDMRTLLQAAAPALEAPAHQCCNSWFLSLPEGRQAVLRENQWMLADAAYQAGRESRSALEAPAAPAEFDAWWERAGDGRSKLMAKQAWDAALAAAPQAPAAPVAVTTRAELEKLQGGAGSMATIFPADASGFPVRLYAAPAAPAVDAQGERDAAFEAVRQRLRKVPRWSFNIDSRGNIRRVDDARGNWIEFSAAHELFDPVAVDAAIAAQAKEGGA